MHGVVHTNATEIVLTHCDITQSATRISMIFFFPYNRSQSFGIALPSFEFQISSSFEMRWKYSERRYWKAKLLFRDVILLCLFSFSLLIALTFSNWVSNLTTFLYIAFSEVTPKYRVIFFPFFYCTYKNLLRIR